MLSYNREEGEEEGEEEEEEEGIEKERGAESRTHAKGGKMGFCRGGQGEGGVWNVEGGKPVVVVAEEKPSCGRRGGGDDTWWVNA